MRFLKTLFIVIALLALFVFSLGFFKPSVDYGAEIEVNKSIQVVWNLHKDDSQYHKWLEGFKSIEHLSGEKEAVGSTYKVIVNPGEGQEDFEMIETITGIKENEFIDLNFVSDFMDFDQKTTFSESAGKTIIKTESKASGKGYAMRAMFALMELFSGSFQKQEQKNMDAFKELIESS